MTEMEVVPIETWRRALNEARFWRDACRRQADLASRDHQDSPQRMAFLLGRIAEGPTRPPQGVCSLPQVGDAALELRDE